MLPGPRIVSGLHGASNHRNGKAPACLPIPGHYQYSPMAKKPQALGEGKHLDNRKLLGPYISCSSNCNKTKIEILLLV